MAGQVVAVEQIQVLPIQVVAVELEQPGKEITEELDSQEQLLLVVVGALAVLAVMLVMVLAVLVVLELHLQLVVHL
jgi:hypothetical protein